ncbi:MAG: hypothetical protein ACE5KM_24335 [Planctomycetaceae bacterium]
MTAVNGSKQITLFQTERNNGESTYEPLSSVWEGSDGELLEAMLSFYSSINPEPILDATYNTGRFWVRSNRNVWSMDIDPKYAPRVVADNRVMVGLNTLTGERDYRVRTSSFGTIVYDPPHVGPQGRDKSVKRFDVDFGATMACGKEHGWTLSYLYPPFFEQAKRVLKPDGLLLAKITDMVNSHKSRWPHCDFMRMAEEAGFTVCDLIVKVRTGPMRSTKWKTAHHARKRHCFWIVCRNSNVCERKPLFNPKVPVNGG